MLLSKNQLWDRLRASAEASNNTAVLSYMNSVEVILAAEIEAQQARFASYLPMRPADEPHDARCQVTREGPQYCCTCQSNMTRRRQQVANAAKAGDMDFRATLGGMESHAFDMERQHLCR
jgi:hypothetical protein